MWYTKFVNNFRVAVHIRIIEKKPVTSLGIFPGIIYEAPKQAESTVFLTFLCQNQSSEKLAICQGINPTFWSKEKASDRIDESVFPGKSTAFFESVKPGIVKIVCLIHCAGLYLFKSFSFDPRRIECSVRR